MNRPADYDHLMQHAMLLFPNTDVQIIYDDEIIHIDLNGHRFTFEIGSDDDAYLFEDGTSVIEIPLMKNPASPEGFS